MTITTERLLLRPITEADAEEMLQYARSPEVGPNAGWKPHADIEETRAVIREVFAPERLVFGMVLRETGRLIGSAGLMADPKRENKRAMMLGYALGREYWGRGLTTEASRAVLRHGFENEGLSLISVYCYPENERSKNVIRKCGFEYEGRLRLCEERYDGLVFDNECYSLTREAYFGR